MEMTRAIHPLTNLVALLILFSACMKTPDYLTADPESAAVVTQKLVTPPFVPEHEQVAKGPPRLVKIRMTIEGKLVEIDAEGTKAWIFAFNGMVPGPLVVAHQYDWVELTLVNPPTNRFPHNIDFHAATGAMGGGRTHVHSSGAGSRFAVAGD